MFIYIVLDVPLCKILSLVTISIPNLTRFDALICFFSSRDIGEVGLCEDLTDQILLLIDW